MRINELRELKRAIQLIADDNGENGGYENGMDALFVLAGWKPPHRHKLTQASNGNILRRGNSVFRAKGKDD